MLTDIILNGINIGELAAVEAISVDVPVGESTLKVQHNVSVLPHDVPRTRVTRKFLMEQDQKRFYIIHIVNVHVLIGIKVGLIEVPADEFFRY